MKSIAAMMAITALLVSLQSAIAGTDEPPVILISPGSNGGTVGVCLLLDSEGHVRDARVVTPSGDPQLDHSIVDYTKSLHWDKPYPKPGWMGINMAVGNGTSSGNLPDCSAVTSKAPQS